MKRVYLLLLPQLFSLASIFAQPVVDIENFGENGAEFYNAKEGVVITWPSGKGSKGKLVLNLDPGKPLFKSIQLAERQSFSEIASNLNPAFVLRVGKRTLSPSSGGWDVFFDRVPSRPFQTYLLDIEKRKAKIRTEGARTVVTIPGVKAPGFSGDLEITLYNESPLFNISATVSTDKDSTAILYDAGLVSEKVVWKSLAWSDLQGTLRRTVASPSDVSRNLEVKYRAIIGESHGGSLALFPAPHQYFYPLDEAYNLKFTWYGKDYLKMISGFALGIRQDPEGDKRFVPWFNAPPGTRQRLNFFCLLSKGDGLQALNEVKKYTHHDAFKPLPGYKTMASHFHNEFISNVALAGKPVPENPEFVDVLKKAGLDIVKLAEFHGPGHPKGPDSVRLKELASLFEQTERLSNKDFLLMPGEEANNFYGGHWLAFFPKPVYWVMSRGADQPFLKEDQRYGRVYHVGNKAEMQKLLELEGGLAWVAHARTKGSTGFPDLYKNEDFFKSDTYLGAAWKAIPADLSWETLSKRVLNLMDDMANWGLKKHVISESDIFTITHQNEMYAHLNVNYLQMDKLPDYKDGWKEVLDVLRAGKFFVSTGEVLFPSFSINGKAAGETLILDNKGDVEVKIKIDWTYPLNYAEIISGDGTKVYRQRINLNSTTAFGKKEFRWSTNLAGKKWVRVEAWDIAANGAFTQMIWIK
ncbi:hypothetical protein [Desertivirga arenae]|uniref:hypothetical protein n=1 Tax=Desertivirga arenae TaxID=2810309 RepID=UPI001A96F43F|nr:hypothetical protein [Pedobacter sp. SYSU D00823]